jgi:hypothetical protein
MENKMMVDTAEQSLPPLAPSTQWDTTIHGLHLAAQPLGALRLLVLDRMPNYLEWSLEIHPDGLSTGRLPRIGEVVLNFQRSSVVYRPEEGEAAEILLEGQTQASLLEALLSTIDVRGSSPFWHPKTGTRTDALLTALGARGHPFAPRRDDIAAGVPLSIVWQLSADYSRALYQIFTAAARFRARLVGPMTPVVVWPEHFDLSFLWFATPESEEQYPHMNFGFAPFSDDSDRPYLYAYAYPMPEGFERLSLPPRAHWHLEGWQGMVYPYDDLVNAANPEAEIEAIFTAVYRTLAPSLLA